MVIWDYRVGGFSPGWDGPIDLAHHGGSKTTYPLGEQKGRKRLESHGPLQRHAPNDLETSHYTPHFY
jgi:hypothetical protein